MPPGLLQKVQQVHSSSLFEPLSIPDLNLDGGGFFSSDDRRNMERIRETAPASLASLDLKWDDARLPEMLFRYRARNWPDTLSAGERRRWQEISGRSDQEP